MAKKEPSKQELEAAVVRLGDEVGRQIRSEDVGPILEALGWEPSSAHEDPFAATPVKLPEPPEHNVTFILRLHLEGTRPAIWRLLELPGDLTLDRLHQVIQLVMGWGNRHLHRFELPSSGQASNPYFVNDGDEDPESGTHEARVRLDQVVQQPDDHLIYQYDFGDGWEHVVTVSEVTAPGEGRVRCLGGGRACPPEDSGGLGGYAELLRALKTPAGERDDEDQRRIDWMPLGFDPARFDPMEADQVLHEWQEGHVIPGASPPPRALEPVLGTTAYLPADLVDLLDAALSDEAPAPSPQVAAQLVNPWMLMLREVGDGLRLTQAGYLPPASVARLVEQLGVGDVLPGKGNREDHARPVAELHATSKALGLVRTRHGRLLLTRLGRTFVNGTPEGHLDDTTATDLLRHIEDRLPLPASPFGTQAAALLLAAVAAGASSLTALDQVADLLTQLGWSVEDGQIEAMDVRREADSTDSVLSLLQIATGDQLPARSASDEVRDVARRALADPDAPRGVQIGAAGPGTAG